MAGAAKLFTGLFTDYHKSWQEFGALVDNKNSTCEDFSVF